LAEKVKTAMIENTPERFNKVVKVSLFIYKICSYFFLETRIIKFSFPTLFTLSSLFPSSPRLFLTVSKA